MINPSKGVEVHDSNTLTVTRQREVLVACYESHRVDGHCLGWLPRVVYDKRHEEGRIAAVYNNGDHVGHCMWAPSDGLAKIFMTWVRPDARMILHGRALVEHVERKAALHGCHTTSLWCAQDLAANYFWRALGFANPSWRYGRGANPRRHLLWRRKIITHLATPLPTPLVEPREFARTSRTETPLAK